MVLLKRKKKENEVFAKAVLVAMVVLPYIQYTCGKLECLRDLLAFIRGIPGIRRKILAFLTLLPFCFCRVEIHCEPARDEKRR